MKLLTRYNRVNITTAFFVLLVCSFTFYVIIRQILLQQIDRDLAVEEEEIKEYVAGNDSLPGASSYKGQIIRFEMGKAGDNTRKVESTLQYDSLQKENELVRQLSFSIVAQGKNYQAVVIKSQAETDDLLRLMVLVTGGIFLLLLVLVMLINRFILAKLWQPFYTTLKQLRSFNLNNSNTLQLPGSELDEFKELNNSVSEMAERVRQEFETLKSFTDNASHEMQTPLAIINSKLDLLIQSSTENQQEHLQAIYDAANRLRKLNQTLLLLTKIDNQLYNPAEAVDLKGLLEKKFQQLEELIIAKDILLHFQLAPAACTMNGELADLMINNLLNNAIKHNYKGGTINCVLTADYLTISNTGQPLTFSGSNIFDRFQKSSHSDGTGLGLAVVKQICNTSNLSVTYSFDGKEHVITIALMQARAP